jgi:hypothetical protein
MLVIMVCADGLSVLCRYVVWCSSHVYRKDIGVVCLSIATVTVLGDGNLQNITFLGYLQQTTYHSLSQSLFQTSLCKQCRLHNKTMFCTSICTVCRSWPYM